MHDAKAKHSKLMERESNTTLLRKLLRIFAVILIVGCIAGASIGFYKGFNPDLHAGEANEFHGLGGNDRISGGDGDDMLYGGAGTDTLTGGSDADTFVFEMPSALIDQDTITDFNTTQSDKIDLHDVIDAAFDPSTNSIGDFVNFRNSGGSSIMSVDRDGLGATYGFVDVATLNGVTNLDETTLYNNANLLAE